ncbi:hypothetical protein N825_25005 [Skermanella stibiiresistens SB22]|uniref:Uncharacterized protein n=2 Tax=Skermanella TaxID=204447 RepID=W9HD82_9PROT|nr:hypothetical protein N825_25005 [Skermanella stibiiresistens SB22]
MMPQRRVVNGISREIAPIWRPTIDDPREDASVSFLDLMELKIIRAMIENGRIKRPKIRACIKGWRNLTQGMPHYLVNKKFAPRLIPTSLAVEIKDEGVLVDAATQQCLMAEVIQPELIDLDYGSSDLPHSWIPKGWENEITVSPLLSFGEPVISKELIPTSALALAVEADGVEAAAMQFHVPLQIARLAAGFELSLVKKQRKQA